MKNIENFEQFNEKSSEKWIKDAIKRPGALRMKLGKKSAEKISSTEIRSEISKLKKKDKDKSKPGIQGLSKKDLTKFRQLSLAKTLKGLKENHGHENYMFFNNLETIKRMAEELLSMDHEKMDSMMTNGHDWATDHVAVAKEDLEQVYDFFMSDEEHSHDMEDMDMEEDMYMEEDMDMEVEEEEEEEEECPRCKCSPCKCWNE
jgi:hypothetical protein